MSFRRRNYPEVLDNLLTSLVGGVAAESHPFPPTEAGPFAHALEQPPVRQLVSVHGVRNGASVRFRADTDYRLEADQQTLRWLTNAALPDPGTLVLVNYLREDEIPTLSDLQVGSVLRTVSESVAMEIARLYAQLQAVHDAGFIDTATGSALDKVVALLDVQRIQATRPSVKLRFQRTANSRGSIHIPAGTRVLDEQVKFEYETIEGVTLADNQDQLSATARDLEAANEPVPADTLTLLASPIAGIRSVTNPAPARRGEADETDAELRTRAKNFLHGSERATLGALRQVLARQQIKADLDDGTPGLISVTPHGDDLSPEQLLQLQTELDATRPAGVQLHLQAPLAPQLVDLDLRLETAPGSLEDDLRAAHAQVQEGVRAYFASLETRANARINQIVGLVLAVPRVEDVQIESARGHETVNGMEVVTERLDLSTGLIDLAGRPTELGSLRLADPQLPTRLEVVIGFPADADIPLQSALETSLAEALAYLNQLTGQDFDPNDSQAVGRRQLSLGKFLLLLPLPGFTAQTLPAHDANPGALPSLTERAPYQVGLFLHQSTGLTRIIEDDVTQYTLSAGERLSLSRLTIRVEPS